MVVHLECMDECICSNNNQREGHELERKWEGVEEGPGGMEIMQTQNSCIKFSKIKNV